ncbi:MAG: hypothetical protein H6624_15965 [Bdellovibrionaceae bacterium]|nr:hypothetical protein [Bdellovibrionales bacterium]MCB9085844.1 hypothetical protein [Pseudobdellovibrionaceae bacterium]
MGLRLLIALSCMFFMGKSWAENSGPVEHPLLRRITVFPLQADNSLTKATEEAWWQVRESLTENRRFLVASKNFLIQKDVYQPRGELSPADAIILGKLLDAHALVVTYLKAKTLYMKVYEGDYGRLLWHHEFRLQPSIPVARQIPGAAKKLILDFIASIPYQGFVVVDSLIGKPVYSEKDKYLVKIDVGENSLIETGDQVQLVRVFSDNLRPLFIDGATSEIFAEGRVVAANRNVVTVEVLRATKLAEIKEMSLVRLPRELKRLRQSYALRQSTRTGFDPEIMAPGMTSVDKEIAEKKPLVTSISFIVNLAAWLILAF